MLAFPMKAAARNYSLYLLFRCLAEAICAYGLTIDRRCNGRLVRYMPFGSGAMLGDTGAG